MIEEHKNGIFEMLSKDTVLWRYMSLEKFIILLKQKSLYFCCINCFEDKNEGVLPTIDIAMFKTIGFNEKDWDKIRNGTFINCWIESPYELALMWESYGKGGVAIQSTVDRICRSMKHDKRTVYMGRVKYLIPEDVSTQIAGEPINYMKASMAKRKYYTQEQEVRLLYHDEENYKEKNGVLFEVDLPMLIEKVVINPKAPSSFKDTIKEMSRCWSLDIPVESSEIIINQ